MQIILFRCKFLILLKCLLVIPFCSQAETVQFDGTLVEDACEIYPGDEDITLDFGTIVDKYLYLNGRTHSEPFQIRLINCDLTLGKEVQFTFRGTDSAIPGLLALDPTSEAKGVAIGLETEDGRSIPLNKSKSYIQKLYSGNGNNLNLNAYVRGEPIALSTKTIELGGFSATGTFTLDYE